MIELSAKFLHLLELSPLLGFEEKQLENIRNRFCIQGHETSRSSTNILLNLGNDIRYGHVMMLAI